MKYAVMIWRSWVWTPVRSNLECVVLLCKLHLQTVLFLVLAFICVAQDGQVINEIGASTHDQHWELQPASSEHTCMFHLLYSGCQLGAQCISLPHLLLSLVGEQLTLTMLVATIDAQWEGIGDVGSARYEPALLPPCLTTRVLSYSN